MSPPYATEITDWIDALIRSVAAPSACANHVAAARHGSTVQDIVRALIPDWAMLCPRVQLGPRWRPIVAVYFHSNPALLHWLVPSPEVIPALRAHLSVVHHPPIRPDHRHQQARPRVFIRWRH